MSTLLGELDLYLIGEGTHTRLYDVMGAHVRTVDGMRGTSFAVWAPNARRVSVVGDWNAWDGRVDALESRGSSGVWEGFVPNVAAGSRYKFELEDAGGTLLALKADPFAFTAERRPNNASIVWDAAPFAWTDGDWVARGASTIDPSAPIAIYEVHAGSWRRPGNDPNAFYTYRELAELLIPYVRNAGFTHIELMPIGEHPFDGSWGYQTTGWFAPTSRFGTPDDFRAFVDAAHAAGIGVIVDWVPGHFPTDDWSLGRFDGTALYEHADPRKGFHREWGTFAFNHGRTEVANFLLASALFWLREFHIDGLRVDAVSSMIYLDYSRKAGEWIPNIYGGNENLESTAFLRRFNDIVAEQFPAALTIAEESTAWTGVTAPTAGGGLGFRYKWNMGWMHDTLQFFSRDPLYRGYHLDDISFGLVYAYSERYVLPLSHDEVVHGKKSLLDRMPGVGAERFADLRTLFALMYAHPGKKLIFAGGEFGQWAEWDANGVLAWEYAQEPLHAGITRMLSDANTLYRTNTALHERDSEPDGFEWIHYDDRENATVAFVRFDRSRANHLIALFNCSGRSIEDYRIGVPALAVYRELLNTDAQRYGGSSAPAATEWHAQPIPMHGRPHSIVVSIPPRTGVWLAP